MIRSWWPFTRLPPEPTATQRRIAELTPTEPLVADEMRRVRYMEPGVLMIEALARLRISQRKAP